MAAEVLRRSPCSSRGARIIGSKLSSYCKRLTRYLLVFFADRQAESGQKGTWWVSEGHGGYRRAGRVAGGWGSRAERSCKAWVKRRVMGGAVVVLTDS